MEITRARVRGGRGRDGGRARRHGVLPHPQRAGGRVRRAARRAGRDRAARPTRRRSGTPARARRSRSGAPASSCGRSASSTSPSGTSPHRRPGVPLWRLLGRRRDSGGAGDAGRRLPARRPKPGVARRGRRSATARPGTRCSRSRATPTRPHAPAARDRRGRPSGRRAARRRRRATAGARATRRSPSCRSGAGRRSPGSRIRSCPRTPRAARRSAASGRIPSASATRSRTSRPSGPSSTRRRSTCCASTCLALGGVTPARRVRRSPRERGVPVSFHIYPEVSVHLAPLGNRAPIVETFDPDLPGGNPLDPAHLLCPGRPACSPAGRPSPPDAPGLGFELDWAASGH